MYEVLPSGDPQGGLFLAAGPDGGRRAARGGAAGGDTASVSRRRGDGDAGLHGVEVGGSGETICRAASNLVATPAMTTRAASRSVRPALLAVEALTPFLGQQEASGVSLRDNCRPDADGHIVQADDPGLDMRHDFGVLQIGDGLRLHRRASQVFHGGVRSGKIHLECDESVEADWPRIAFFVRPVGGNDNGRPILLGERVSASRSFQVRLRLVATTEEIRIVRIVLEKPVEVEAGGEPGFVGLGVGRLDEMPLPRVGGRLPVAALGVERPPLLFPFFLAQGAQRPFRREVLAGTHQDPGPQAIWVHVIGDGQETDVPQPGGPVIAGGDDGAAVGAERRRRTRGRHA